MKPQNRRPHAIDIHVGARIRQARKTAGKRQSELAAAVNLSSQQIQKYERGTDRISCSKLHAIARTLDTQAAYFFEGYQDDTLTPGPSGTERAMWALLTSQDCIALVQVFPKIRNARHRRKILKLIQALAEPAEA